MIKFVFFFLAIFQRKEVEDMAVIYATLIVKRKKENRRRTSKNPGPDKRVTGRFGSAGAGRAKGS